MGAFKTNSFKKGVGPYFIIVAVGLLAWFPVSALLLSLKNDALNLDLPVKYFISQCIYHGISPVWMDTWALGFPLQSTVNWSIFNPVQLLFYSLFSYNVYTLQWEFLFYIIASGCGMYWLLNKQLKVSAYAGVLLSIAYMLSGFAVSSAQFLLFISSLAFIPFCYASVFQYLNNPTYKNGLLFALFYYLLLTGSYPPYVIIITYSIVAAFIVKLVLQRKSLQTVDFNLYWKKLLKTILPIGLFMILLSAPFIYFTLEIMSEMERGVAISNTSYQHSNFLHPSALLTFLIPFSSVSLEFENTSRLMQDSYFGLVSFIFCFPAAIRAFRNKDKVSLVFFFSAIACLLFSFDEHLPFRSWLNLLWGMNFFRGASIFRLLAIFFLLCFLAPYFSSILKNWFDATKGRKRLMLSFTVGFLFLSVLIVSIIFLNGYNSGKSVLLVIKSLFDDNNNLQIIWISISLQLALLGLFSMVFWKNSKRWFAFVFAGDLVLNTLICMPFFAVSSYSPASISKILSLTDGFKTSNTVLVNYAGIRDQKGNPFYNTNVFQKKVSLDNFYVYPIVLKQSAPVIENLKTLVKNDKPELPFIAIISSPAVGDSVTLVKTEPGDIRFSYHLSAPGSIRISQNYFPGWSAKMEGKDLALQSSSLYGMVVNAPAGDGTIQLVYQKKGLVIAAIVGAIVFFTGLMLFIISGIKARREAIL